MVTDRTPSLFAMSRELIERHFMTHQTPMGAIDSVMAVYRTTGCPKEREALMLAALAALAVMKAQQTISKGVTCGHVQQAKEKPLNGLQPEWLNRKKVG
jgi:hypothetical protein